MKKFLVNKETIETARHEHDWTVADMESFEMNRCSKEPVTVKTFDSKEEAEDFFKDEKTKCSSYYQDGSVMQLVIFDYLTLEEVEYDEDGDYIDSQVWDSFIAPIE